MSAQPLPPDPLPTEPDHRGRDRPPPLRRRRAASVIPLRDFQPHALAIEETPPSPSTGTLLWSLAALLAVAIGWSYVSEIPIMTTAPGKFVPGAHTKVVQSLNTGTVSSILVKTGDAVSKGQVLLTLSPGVDHAKLAAARRDLGLDLVQQQRILSELGLARPAEPARVATRAMLTLEGRLASSQLVAERNKIEVDRAQEREAEANLAAGRAMLGEYTTRTAQDLGLARAASPLVGEGAISGQDYTQLQDQAIVDEGQLRAQRQQVSQLAAALTAAKSQLKADARTFESDRYQDLEASVDKGYDLQSQYVEAQRDVAMDRLRAPVAGTVQTLDVASLGTVVQPGQTVVTIVPRDAPLVVEVDLPAQDVGFVKVGQKTQIKVTAYPFEQYGSIPGKVIWISPTAGPSSILASLPEGENHQPVTQPSQSSEPGADQTRSISPPTLYYHIKVQPERRWLGVDGQHDMMRAGMTASVDIETGRRRVLDFFLDPVIRYVDTGLKVR
jgi:membrane fusion protein, hemolysin D